MTHYQCPKCDREGKTRKELRENGCHHTTSALIMLDGFDEAEKILQKKKQKEKEEDDRSTSKKIYDFAMSKIKKLVISEGNSDEVYALVETNNHIETLNLESKRTRQWIRDQYSRNVESNDIHGDDYFKAITDEITAKAQMNGTERVKIYNRIAQLKDQIFYDLGTPDWCMVRITPLSVTKIPYDITSPVFQRRQSLQMQVIPKTGDGKELNKFADLLAIIESDKPVFIVHLICMFLESRSVPMMVFDGSAGSLKTTATSAIKRVVDPNGKGVDDNVSAMAEKNDDLIIQLNHRYLASFDNVSYINQNTSDVLCRAITGSGNMRRKKYTDDNEVIHNFRRKIVLNGIVPNLEYPDLQTRLLSYARKPIDDNNRITEEEFNERLEGLLPGLLDTIFDILSKTLKIYPELKSKIKPKTRMSDFEIWGEIIARILGYAENSFLEMYNKKMREGQISQIDAHPVVASIQTFMEGKDSYEDTASHLYQTLVNIAVNSGVDLNSKYVRFPKTPSYLAKELKIVDPVIKTMGFVIEKYHYMKNDGKFTKNSTVIRITRKASQGILDDGKIDSPPSPSSPIGNLDIKIGETTGEAIVHQFSTEKPGFTQKLGISEASETGEPIRESQASSEKFYCKTCNCGPWSKDAKGSIGMPILDFHKDQGHEIQFLAEDE